MVKCTPPFCTNVHCTLPLMSKVNIMMACLSLWLSTDAAQVFMPSLSPTMQRGTIVKWYKQEGRSAILLTECFDVYYYN